MDNEELDYLEIITLEQESESFVDADGIYELINNNWFEVIYTGAKYTLQVVH